MVAILGLLMGILIPSLSAARRTAKANVCLSHLKGIGNSFSIYLNENDDRFPPVRLERVSPTAPLFPPYINEFQRGAPRWQWFLETDLGAVIDPTPFRPNMERQLGFFADFTTADLGGQSGTTMSIELFTCPSLDDEQFAIDIRDGAYGYNYQYLGNTYQDTSLDRWDNFVVGRHRIRKAGNTVLVADSRGAGRRHGRHSFTLDPPRMAVEVNAGGFGPRTETYDDPDLPGDEIPGGLDPNVYTYSPMEPRHRNLGNVLFADTHAGAMTLVELGYQLSDGSDETIPKGVPMPIHDPMTGTYTASNRLWSGEGSDPIAFDHRPSSEP